MHTVWRFSKRIGIFVFVFMLAGHVLSDAPNPVTVRTKRAQELLDELRGELSISSQIQVAVVNYEPLVFSVQPLDKQKTHFLLKMELGFLVMLDERELRAALAHELGHVWLYTHQPYLQAERLANTIGLRVIDRASFEQVYAKMWMYEGAAGVPFDDLLGNRP